jgi:hypothetical protein
MLAPGRRVFSPAEKYRQRKTVKVSARWPTCSGFREKAAFWTPDSAVTT